MNLQEMRNEIDRLARYKEQQGLWTNKSKTHESGYYIDAMQTRVTINEELARLYAIEDRLNDTIANFKAKVDKSNLNFLASDIELLEHILNGKVEK